MYEVHDSLQGGLDVVNRIFKHVFKTTHRCGPEDPEGVVSPRAQNNSAVVSLCAANVGGERGARLTAGCSRVLTSGRYHGEVIIFAHPTADWARCLMRWVGAVVR